MPPNTRTLKGQSYSTKRWANLAWPKGSKLSGFSTGINKRVSFHTGRHSFATLTLAATNDIATVSRLLGHTSVATTQIYAEVLMEDKIAAVNKLNGIF